MKYLIAMCRGVFIAGFVFAWICCSGCAGTKSTTQEHVPNTVCNNYCFAGVVLFEPENARNGYLKNNYYPLWMPSSNAVDGALSQISNYLQHAENEPLQHHAYAKELAGIRNRLPQTVCQVVGVTYSKQKAILLNCLPSDNQDWREDWKNHFVKIFDGGPKYWSVIYLPSEQRFVRLVIDLGF